MCSVVGCSSWLRAAQRFKLPEDPEKRLKWVQFLLEVNRQRLKESSCTDITICKEHFTGDCFETLTETCAVLLKPSAVPCLCVQSELQQHAESVPTTEVACQCDEACIDPTSYSKKSKRTLTADVTSGYGCIQQNILNSTFDKQTFAFQQVEGKRVVNESCLLQLFRQKCPSCGCKLQAEKVTCGVLVALNQWCLQCEYRNQWKSQVNASVPTAEDQVTSEAQAVPTDDNLSCKIVSEIITFSDEECDPSDEVEDGDEEDEGDEGEASSDGEWNPPADYLLTKELRKESEDLNSLDGLKINELCTECGSFFNVQKPHTCEHKMKPYSCNICGKRCVTELSLKNHSIIHNETYEHPCKYCHVTFKTRLDKLKHEQIHVDSKDPYKCPDCPQTFASNKALRVHLANHRTQKEFKCGLCGIVFNDVHPLRRHSFVHTGLKPYKCSVCQRGFSQGSHLKSHMRLHTGERPYKCQRCDKCFNHNVSLKSHVQRYHSGHKWENNDQVGDTGDDRGNRKGTDSESDNVEEQEEVQREIGNVEKSGRRCTGRPKGRPKRNAPGNLTLPGQMEDQRSNSKTVKSKRLKKMDFREIQDSEDEQSVSDSSIDSSEEDKGAEKKMKTRRRKSRRRQKQGSDSDFEPELETKRKMYNCHSSGTSRRRPKKSLVV